MTGKNHLISVFSSTHPDFPDDLWDRLLPYAEITLNVLRPCRPDPTLSAWSGLHRLPYDFSAHPLHPPGQLYLAFSSSDHRDIWAPHGDRAFTLGPALTHYCCQRVYVVSSRSERITLTLWLPWRVLASTGPVLYSTHFFCGTMVLQKGTM